MADKPNLIHVEIFGQSYAVRAGTDPGYVERLAAYVDGQMREISRTSGAVDSVRVAVLAALAAFGELVTVSAWTTPHARALSAASCSY